MLLTPCYFSLGKMDFALVSFRMNGGLRLGQYRTIRLNLFIWIAQYLVVVVVVIVAFVTTRGLLTAHPFIR